MTEEEELKDRYVRRLSKYLLKYRNKELGDLDFYGYCLGIFKEAKDNNIILNIGDSDAIRVCYYLFQDYTIRKSPWTSAEYDQRKEKMLEMVQINRRDSGLDSLLEEE